MGIAIIIKPNKIEYNGVPDPFVILNPTNPLTQGTMISLSPSESQSPVTTGPFGTDGNRASASTTPETAETIDKV